MKVLHVVPGLTESSGPTQAVRSLALAQTRLGCDVTIATTSGRGTDHDPDKFPDVRVVAFPTMILKHWAYSPGLRFWLDQNVPHFDHVHIHSLWLYPGLAASWSCRKFGVPYWVRPAGSLEKWSLAHKSWKKSVYYHLIERRILQGGAAIHAVSAQEAESVGALGLSAEVTCIPNGTDIPGELTREHLVTFRAKCGLPESTKVVLYIGRFHAVKGLDVLAAAMKELRASTPSATLLLVGPINNDYATNIRKLYEQLGLMESTRFLGELRGEEKEAALRTADVLVLPSRSENFGMVVVEALAHGLPVVTTKNTPWQDLETWGAGVWCDLTPQALSCALQKVLESSESAAEMGKRGRDLVAAKYSWDSIAREMREAYRRTGSTWLEARR